MHRHKTILEFWDDSNGIEILKIGRFSFLNIELLFLFADFDSAADRILAKTNCSSLNPRKAPPSWTSETPEGRNLRISGENFYILKYILLQIVNSMEI